MKAAPPRWSRGLVTASLLLLAAGTSAQEAPDPELLREIRAIRAIDNHSHLPPTEPAKPVLPAGGGLGTPEFDYPVRLRPDNPEWARAWKALYGVEVAEMTSAAVAPVLARKWERVQEAGSLWGATMLDASSIDVALINVARPGPAQVAPRFLWVPTANALLQPFQEGGARPASLEAYERDVVGATLSEWKKAGAVAIKLSVAYRRTLEFAAASPVEAARVYADRLALRSVSSSDAKLLEDHLFRILLRQAGPAGLVVHIHTGIGADPWFGIGGANPLLLEDALGDAGIRTTKVVLIHGAWPFDREAGVMLIKPNVWADVSAQTFLRSPRALAGTLRGWLEWYPGKVLFGTDAYPDPGMPLAGWEEMLWLANDSARQALAIALTGMMRDGQVTRERAAELARLVLRENARKLYGLSGPGAAAEAGREP